MRNSRSRPYFSVVIPAWNEEKYLGNCLDALARQSLPRKEFEVIVVNDDSTDRTGQVAKRHFCKILTFSSGGKIGKTRNFGAKRAVGKVLAFIDADSIAREDWLENAQREFSENPGLAGLGGETYPLRGNLRDALFFLFMNKVPEFLSAFGIYLFSGNNSFYERGAFLSVGGFHSKRDYLEDLELSRRLERAGKRCKFSSKAVTFTSTRRFREEGTIGTLWTFVTGLFHFFLGREHKTNYARRLPRKA